MSLSGLKNASSTALFYNASLRELRTSVHLSGDVFISQEEPRNPDCAPVTERLRSAEPGMKTQSPSPSFTPMLQM